MPKKKDQNPKNEKQITKLAKDATFGMKNKNKSKKVAKLVSQIASKDGGLEQMRNKMYEEKKRKKLEEFEKKLLGDVHAKVVVHEAKKAMCQFFKVGLCNKGKRCKKSHNLQDEIVQEMTQDQQEEEGQKIDLFTDQRDILFGNKDNITNWDDKKLQEVVDFNYSKYQTSQQTSKVCKNFLEAVEKRVYGWMWVCPNGHQCQFRHCLPQGYVFKGKEEVVKKKGPTEDEFIDNIDDERAKIDTEKATPITQENFFKWLEKRKIEKAADREKRIEQQMLELGIKPSKGLTGKELFEQKKIEFNDAEDAVEDYQREENIEIDNDAFQDEELPVF